MGRKLVPDNPKDPDCCCDEIQLGFYVFLTNQTKINPHHKVDKGNGWTGRPDMKHWGDLNPDTMLHEIMHMFGVKDEYLDGVAYPDKSQADLPSDAASGIMGNGGSAKPILDRHINEIVSKAQSKFNGSKGCEISVK